MSSETDWIDAVYTDMYAVAHQITNYIEYKGGAPSQPTERIALLLTAYIRLRTRAKTSDWQLRSAAPRPKGWSAQDEAIWQDWLYDTFVSWEWDNYIIKPVFGTDVRDWEQYAPADWRADIWRFVHQWVVPTYAIVDRYDPCANMEDEVADGDTDAIEQEKPRRR
jgi:hypothetical protein